MPKLYLLPALLLACLTTLAQDYKQQARVLLEKNLRQARLHSADEVRVTDAYPNGSSGTFLVYAQQLYQEIPVSNAVRTLVFKDGSLVSQRGEFVKLPKGKVARNLLTLTAAEAVDRALAHLNIPVPAQLSRVPLRAAANGQSFTFAAAGALEEDIPVQLLWIPEPQGSLTLCWEVGVVPPDTTANWLVRVEAASGRIVGKVNLTVYCAWDVPAPAAPQPVARSAGYFAPPPQVPLAVNSATYRVVPFPAESPQHPGGGFVNVTNPWLAAGAGNPAITLQWHNDGATEYSISRGNNVHAQEDADGNNGTGTPATSSTPLPDLTFTSVFNPDSLPSKPDNQAAAITNLFYWNNIVHDVMYQYGFDELAGNFQNSNLGRGGQGGDYVLADAQDGSGTNNANFSVGADGFRPRMQMYLFNPPPGSSVPRDGDLDNGIIVHEYGHGVSIRLTGGPSQPACLQNAEQMGEGWSDYYTLLFTTDWNSTQTTDGPLAKPIGTYAIGQSTAGSGIRTHPYSTDLGVNPFTYADVAASPSVHYIGSIWCTMIWDMTWEIIQEAGITTDIYEADSSGGNVVAMRLVTEGLKLQPCSPGFVDGRDAILQADTLLYGGQYSCAIWRAFARRGLGFSASQGSSLSYTDQVAAFDLPPKAQITKTPDVNAVALGQEITYTIAVSCRCEAFTNYAVVDSLPANATYVSGGTYDSTSRAVDFGTLSLNPGQSTTYELKVLNTSAYDAVEYFASDGGTLSPWQSETLLGSSAWGVSTARFRSAGASWFIPNLSATNTVTLTSPAYTLDSNTVLFSFWHYIDLEDGYDGGVVEISTDSGATWIDLWPYFIKNGYNYLIDDCCGSPLANRPAFSGYVPFFVNTVADLSSFGNQSVRLRFLYAEDPAVDFEGWYIDDLSLRSETFFVNTAYVLDGSTEVARAANVLPLAPPLDIQSLASGSWTDPATWSCGCVPQPADTVTVNATHTIVIDGVTAKAAQVVKEGGILEVSNGGELRLGF